MLVVMVASAFAVLGVPGNASAYVSHVPVIIDGDSMFTLENGVVGGSGTELDPYLIEGWEFTGGYSGLCLRDTTKYVVISDVYAHGNGVGILLDNVTHVVVRDSVSSLNLQGWDYWGMYVLDSSQVEISNCSLETNIIGIYIESSSDCAIVDNHLYWNTDGLLLEDCDGVTLRSNFVDTTPEDSVTLTRCSSTTVTDNTISQGLPDSYCMTGIGVQDSSVANVSGNYLSFCVSAFRVTGSSGVDFVENVFDNGTMYCFEVYSSSEVTILRNSILNITGSAIYVNGSDAVSVIDNEISSWSYECVGNLMLDWSTDCVVSGNVLADGVQGIALWGASRAHFASHTITDDNMWYGLPVAYYRDIDSLAVAAPMVSQMILANCTDAWIEGVQPTCISIGLYFVSGVDVTGSTLVSYFTSCIEAFHSSDVQVYDSMLMSDGWSMWFHDCADVSVDSCMLNGGFAGANVQFSQNVSLTSNLITGVSVTWGTVSGNGVYSYQTTDLRVCGNMIVSCVHGVLANPSVNLTIDENEVVSCGVGVSLNMVDDGMTHVTNNNITGSAWCGVQLSSCRGVSTYHNAFTDNAVHAADDAPGDNSWDDGYPSGGNYWSDYTGVDEFNGEGQDMLGPDGIGDSPYEFTAASDRYPLMHPLRMDAPPSAWLTVDRSSDLVGAEFSFDASLTYDREDPSDSVQVRWDWDGDLEWDTGWSTDKVVGHAYQSAGDYDVRVEATDSAGQTDVATVAVAVLPLDEDLEAPVLGVQVSGTEGVEGWFTSPVNITLEATDEGSGVLLTEYRVVGSTDWVEYEAPAAFSADGTWVLEARSLDLAGNLAEEEVSFKLDSTAPATAHALNGTVVTLEAEDATSGVAGTWYRIDGGEWTAYGGSFEVVGEGAHTVEYRSVDVAGNEEAAASLEVEVVSTSGAMDLNWWLVLLTALIIIGISIGAILGMRKKATGSDSKAIIKDIGTAVSQMMDPGPPKPPEVPPPGTGGDD